MSLIFIFLLIIEALKISCYCIEGEDHCTSCNPITNYVLNAIKISIFQMKMVVVKNQKNAYLEKIIVVNVIKKETYAKNVISVITRIKMVDVHILIIAIYHIKENALNANIILF